MGEDFKKRDSNDSYQMLGARLTKDAETRDGDFGKLVRLTFASESKREANSTLWIEATVCDFHAELASHLKKGDILHSIRGKPTLRHWGDDNAKMSFGLDRAEVIPPIELFSELKTRGWTPGVKSTTKPAAKSLARPAAKAVKPVAKAKKPVPIAIDDDDEDTDINEDDE